MAALSGISVLAIEQAVAAPFCTSRMADAGATVIKVERPEGDLARGYDDAANGLSSYFVWLNRGKKSVVLDLAGAEGKACFEALVAESDVLVQNLKPGALARLGFGIERLRRDHPALICCSISGYGEEGPFAARKAYDLLIQAESGLASLTGGPEGPARVGISVVDIATGITAYGAILEALLARSRTGRGADIRISMFDVMADWLTVPLLHAAADRPPTRSGLSHPSIAPYGVFSSADGKNVLIAVQNDREWAALCGKVLGQPSHVADARFATNVARVRNRAETDAMVRDCLSSLQHCEIVAKLMAADIAFADLNDMEGLLSHPQLRRMSVATPAGPVLYPPPAPVVDGASLVPGPVPGLGEHTDDVLRCGDRD